MEPTTMLMAGSLGLSALPTVFGKGQVSVPGSMAKPTDPSKSILGKNSFVKGPFSLSGQQDLNQEQAQGLLGNLKSFATQEGPTSIADANMAANVKETQIQKDQLANNMASQRATQEANLAMKSGLGSGSRERLAASTANNSMLQNQNINAQSSLNNLNTIAQDEERKLGLLQSLPGQFLNMGNYANDKKRFDIGNSIGTSTNTYNQQMGAYAGNQLARQQAQSYNSANQGLLGKLTGGLF